MKKYKINGIISFNDFFFKSCYYHQLIAGITSFEIDIEGLFLNAFTKIYIDFNTNKEGVLKEKKLEKILGYKRKRCKINCRKLIKNIDKDSPVIVSVDCYYLESRPETYQVKHMPHYILAYGYDLETREAYVVDHSYLNSYEYKEKIISLDNLLLSNKMQKKPSFKRKRLCYILKRRKKRGLFNIWKYLGKEDIENNLKNSLQNLSELRELIGNKLFSSQINIDKISSYLSELKTFYYTLSKTSIFLEEQDQIAIMMLVNGYSNILSLFWKLKSQKNLDYVAKRKGAILRKLDEIEENEKKVYNVIFKAREYV